MSPGRVELLAELRRWVKEVGFPVVVAGVLLWLLVDEVRDGRKATNRAIENVATALRNLADREEAHADAIRATWPQVRIPPPRPRVAQAPPPPAAEAAP